MAKLSLALTFLSILFIVATECHVPVIEKDDECAPRTCQGHGHGHGPKIQFPFWLSNRQQDRCGYPRFNLTCSEDNQTLISLPISSRTLVVTKIDYKSQIIHLHDPDQCLPLLLKNLSLSPYNFTNDSSSSNSYRYYPYTYQYILFNCSSPERDQQSMGEPGEKFTCLSVPGYYDVYAVDSSYDISSLPLTGCASTGESIDMLPGPVRGFMKDVSLAWTQPSCERCAKAGHGCRLKNGTTSETECFKFHTSDYKGKLLRLGTSGGAVGFFLLLMALVGLCHMYHKSRRDKENEMKVLQFLEDYRAHNPTRFTYSDIKRITGHFKEKLGEGAYGTVYKGKLSNEIFVAVKMLNNSLGSGEEFINEVGTMGRIHHVHVVRLVGFCADGFRRALVYEFLPNDSLEKFIFPADGTLDPSLGWEKLRDIAIGAAKGIEYLHQGCDQRILHFDIKPHNILLDGNFNPKISDFGLAKLCSKEQSAVSMTAARGTMGYIAPEVYSRNFGNVSYKSDVYSFGMLLLEMVGGRKNKDAAYQDTSQMYFPEWVYKHLDKGDEIDIRIKEEGDNKIARKMAIVGLWCIQWYPADRPSMKTVVQMLEAEECPVMPRNPFTSGNTADGGNAHARIWNLELEVIAE